MSVPVIAGLGTAHPPSADQQELWEKFFSQHFSGSTRALAERIFAHSGVTRRQAAVNPLLEDVSDWRPSDGCSVTRSRRYRWARRRSAGR